MRHNPKPPGTPINLRDVRHEITTGVLSLQSALSTIQKDPNFAEQMLKSTLFKLRALLSQIDWATQTKRKTKELE